MSLMQLLTVGRSFQEARNQLTPYKMTEQRYLPKFGVAGAVREPSRRLKVDGDLRGKPRGGRVWKGLFGGRGGRGRMGVVVQGELALDTVKVVRNDLMETDFEVVAGVAPGLESAGGENVGVVGRFVRRLFLKA